MVRIMKKMLMLAMVCALLLARGTVRAEPVRDWHDLDAVHTRVQEAINELERARAAAHFDMDGHGEKAEDLLRRAEQQLRAGVESAKRAR
jgi:hypothetical protein